MSEHDFKWGHPQEDPDYQVGKAYIVLVSQWEDGSKPLSLYVSVKVDEDDEDQIPMLWCDAFRNFLADEHPWMNRNILGYLPLPLEVEK